MKAYFSDFFEVKKDDLDSHGAIDISLINDLPLFIDPFLLFSSDKKEYVKLHDAIIKYIIFLRDRSNDVSLTEGLISHWFRFPEVKQNWLGFSKVGNSGSGLGQKFASALNSNLNTVFSDFSSTTVTAGRHLEKVCLIDDGVGRDNISDFTVNLINAYLCEYTQDFSNKYLDPCRVKNVSVKHAYFDYPTRSWMPRNYDLPYIDGDYVLLTPRDMLTQDETWINKVDMLRDYDDVASAMPDADLRGRINDYLMRNLPDAPTVKEVSSARAAAYRKFPELLDYYIKLKEDNGDAARSLSAEQVEEIETKLVENGKTFISLLENTTEFYSLSSQPTLEEAADRVAHMKQCIEHNDAYRVFYGKNGKSVEREADLQLLFRFTWFASVSDVNSEVNNGRGPVDYKISRGSNDKTLVEFKIAKNTSLKQNLMNQVEVYEAANQTHQSIKVIIFFSDEQLQRVQKILKELKLEQSRYLVLIDARSTNKPSASKVRSTIS